MTDIDGREVTERWVLDVCRDIGLSTENSDSDFFTAGGNSLAAMKLIARAESQYGEDALPAEDLFANSTVRDIADSILRHRTVG